MFKLIGIILGAALIAGGFWLNARSRRDLHAQAELVAAAQSKTASAREATAANERTRVLTDGYVRELYYIIQSGTLSHGQMVEAEHIIRKWKEVSGDLEVHVDKKIQRVYGFDSSVVKKLEQDKKNRLEELEIEKKLLEAESAALNAYVKKAGDF